MNRLTEHFGRYIRIIGLGTLYGPDERKSAPMQSAIVRLAAYEDTGLMPDEILRLSNTESMSIKEETWKN